MKRLRIELLSGNYYPGMIRRVWIPKPGGGKRGLGIPNVIDRIVQQAFLQIIQPHYEMTFHDSSHGFRPGRSCHTALAEAKSYMEEGLTWVVDIDLEKFFDRVNHQRLIVRLERRITDKRVMTTIKRMLKARVVLPDGLVESVEEGVPQGGPLSPLLSNIVLDELDRELSRRGHRFVRYADDSNIYVGSERAGLRVMASVSRFIEKKLRLKVNASKSAVAAPDTRHFLGFSLKYDAADGSVAVALSRRTHERIARRIVELTPRNWGGSIDSCIRHVNRYLRGWMGFFRICSEPEKYFLRLWDAHTRRRLRAIHLKQWKRRRFIYRKLIKLGIKPKTASMVYSRKRKTLGSIALLCSRQGLEQQLLRANWPAFSCCIVG
ncbi:MAG: group II intron reverse transcriptase/maturase [Spirochaetales bacterium]|nr:group II intron reverse transcriptase/maturase [Spirochaetales bacterium]